MALTTAPLMSLDASGSVAKTIVFSKWKGRNYVRQHVTPSNPKTAPQVAQRAMMAFLSRHWAGLSGGTQAGWQPLATQMQVSPFNAFTSYNLSRWTQNLYPTDAPPGGLVATNDTDTTPAGTGGVRQISFAFTVTLKVDGSGLIVTAQTGSSAGSNKAKTRLILDTSHFSTGYAATGIVTGLDPGAWYLSYTPFADDGNPGANVDDSANPITVT